ncbi:MAG: cell division protein ZapE [Rhodococcus sp.]|nr:cell division protein ZapE [Rhodococcus sp. (in: high G+C Gram-positive bacteria)]
MDVELQWDDAQCVAVDRLEATARRLNRRRPWTGNRGPVGVYLWGPVGRGKTVVLDDFFSKVTVPKRRVHFHAFFDELHRSAHMSGSVDRAMGEILHGVRLLCFDEFHVHDVGDATLLTLLLKHIEARGITLVVTSNYPPNGLLPNPLFHHVFQPSIDWIERHLHVLPVDAGVDYRVGGTVNAENEYFASGRYIESDDPILPGEQSRQTLYPGSRGVSALEVDGSAVWFDFWDLCASPTAATDYLVLTETYRWWTISGVPPLVGAGPDAIRRFANVIDVLYDANVAITVIAEAPLTDLVAGAEGSVDLDRLTSRLSLLTASVSG